MQQVLQWLRSGEPPSRRVVEGGVAALWGGHSLPEDVREEVLRGLLLGLFAPLMALAKGRGDRFEELLQEAVARLLEDFLAPGPWRKVAVEAGSVYPALRLWLRSWAPGLAEALAWGLPEKEARRLRVLRARAAHGDKKAQEELNELLLKGVTVSLEGLMWSPEEGEYRDPGVRDPRPYPGEE